MCGAHIWIQHLKIVDTPGEKKSEEKPKNCIELILHQSFNQNTAG